MERSRGLVDARSSLGWAVLSLVVLDLVWCGAAHADRSGFQGEPALMFEKAGNYPQAALYFHRALRGWKEYYFPFLWGDVSNAPGAHKDEYAKLEVEYVDRLRSCIERGKVTEDQRKQMESITELWMNELLVQEGGEYRTEALLRAIEAEKHGDFRLGAILRTCDARFCRTVMAPYHQKNAAECDKAGRAAEAGLHREAAKACADRAAAADRLAEGDKLLTKIPGFGGPDPWVEINVGRTGPMQISAAYQSRVLVKGRDPREVAATLKEQGLKHTEENARLSAVTALANLGEKEPLLSALEDSSAAVRLAAARALAAMRWADGWAACHRHADADVRALVAFAAAPAGKDVLVRTWVITELVRGLDSASPRTRDFCQQSLAGLTGKNFRKEAWLDWWRGLGNPQPGLVRTGPDVPPEVDEAVDFGCWWQSGNASIQNLTNPLMKYQLPVKVEWCGSLAVNRPGEYTFSTRSRAESYRKRRGVREPERAVFPGTFFSNPHLKLFIDGKAVLPGPPSKAAEDPVVGVRIDLGEPVHLDEGLHDIRVEFDIESTDDLATCRNNGILGGQPCIRLYWSSDDFLRRLIPAENLVTKSGGR